MIRPRTIAAALLLTGLLSGCGSMSNLLGTGVDNTVLPGSREDVIPGKAQFPEAGDPSTLQPTGSAGAPPPAAPGEPSAACHPKSQ